MTKLLLPLLCGILFWGNLQAQIGEDSLIRHLHPVEISAVTPIVGTEFTIPMQTITTPTLQRLPILQLSDALKFMSGILIKDWGGVGGLKTVSVRGFGAQHTGVNYDGITVTDCQTGQIDLGKFMTQNLQELTVYIGGNDDIFVSARTLASSSAIVLKRRKPVFKENKPTNLFFNITSGSWTLLNPAARMENRIWKNRNGAYLYSSVDVNYLYSKGNYPYKIYYDNAKDTFSMQRRTHADIQTLSAEGNLYAICKDSTQIDIKIYYYHSQRKLPGAVIYYKQETGQQIWDDQCFGQASWQKWFTRKWAYRIDAKYNYAAQRYVDPEYLNQEHLLDNRYQQQEGYLSASIFHTPHKVIACNISQDIFFNNMTANLERFAKPWRLTLLTALSAKIVTQQFVAITGILHTLAFNYVETGDAGTNANHFAPFVNISIKPFKRETCYLRLLYKNSFRLPTFNDLYYREVGNINLKPEKSHQINSGISYQKRWRGKLSLSIDGDLYYNMIFDKIVAIPNKNLFVWSMLNYGKVEILGIELKTAYIHQIIQKLKLELTTNYAFRQAIDITDATSKSYRQQIPYTPRHTASLACLIKTPYIEMMYTILISGERYVLPENKPSNRLAPYIDQTIALMHDFRIKAVVLSAKIEMLNFMNVQYEIIRNYPMPGRSFRIGIDLKM